MKENPSSNMASGFSGEGRFFIDAHRSFFDEGKSFIDINDCHQRGREIVFVGRTIVNAPPLPLPPGQAGLPVLHGSSREWIRMSEKKFSSGVTALPVACWKLCYHVLREIIGPEIDAARRDPHGTEPAPRETR